MSIARALAILGAGASGFQGGQEQARQRARQEEDDAFRREQRDRTRTDWSRSDEEYARKKADMEAERAAMAPTEMRPELAPDQQGPQAFQVAGKTIADPAAAEAAAKDYNAPQSGMRRAAARVQDPMRAADLQGRANAAEAGDLQMQQAREAAASAAFDRELVGSVQKKGWQGLADFMSKSKADGMGGQSKFAVKVEGGNATIYPVGPDGTAMGQGMTLPDTDEGKAKATFLLSQKTTPAQKLEHFRVERTDKQAEENRQRDDKRQAERDKVDADYKGGMTEYHKAMAGAAQTRASAAGTRASTRADHFDEKEWDAVRKVDPAIVSFDAPDGSGKLVESSDLRTVYIGELNRNRASGTMSPNEAMEASRTTVGALRDKASAIVEAARKADPKATMTEQQAVKLILKEYQKALQAPQAAPGASPTGATPTAGARPAPPVVGSTPRMQSAANQAPTPQEAKMDAAKQAVAMAQAEVMKFGSRQKQTDPAGFERARQAAAQAQVALAAAQGEYEQSLAAGYKIPRMMAQP